MLALCQSISGLVLIYCGLVGGSPLTATFNATSTLNDTLSRPLPSIVRDTFSYTLTSLARHAWPGPDNSVAALLYEAYETAWTNRAPGPTRPGAVYQYFSGDMDAYALKISMLTTADAPGDWTELERALGHLSDDILRNEWSMIGRSPCLISVSWNNAPFFTLAVDKTPSTSVELNVGGKLELEGLLFESRESVYTETLQCIDYAIQAMNDMTSVGRENPLYEPRLLQRNYDELYLYIQLGLTPGMDYVNPWPEVRVDDVIQMTRAVKAWIQQRQRSAGFYLKIFYFADGSNDGRLVGYFQMNEEDFPVPRNIVGGNYTQLGNMTSLEFGARNDTLANGNVDGITNQGSTDISNSGALGNSSRIPNKVPVIS